MEKNLLEIDNTITVMADDEIDSKINDSLAYLAEQVAEMYGVKLKIEDVSWQCIYDIKSEFYNQLEALGLRIDFDNFYTSKKHITKKDLINSMLDMDDDDIVLISDGNDFFTIKEIAYDESDIVIRMSNEKY